MILKQLSTYRRTPLVQPRVVVQYSQIYFRVGTSTVQILIPSISQKSFEKKTDCEKKDNKIEITDCHHQTQK